MNLEQEFQKAIKSGIQILRYRYQIYIKEGMSGGIGGGGNSETIAPNMTGKLDVKSANLLRSFIPNQKGNIDKLTTSASGFDWEFGTSLIYASIHNRGGFIKSKGKMHKYFWAKYYETKNPYMRNMALSVKKKGGVNIPKRPYFDNAEKKIQKDMPDFLQKVIDEFAKTYNNENIEV